VLAGAVPNAASWVVMQVMRSRLDASLMNPNLLPSFEPAQSRDRRGRERRRGRTMT